MATGLLDRTNRSLLPVTLAFAAGIALASRVLAPPQPLLTTMAFLAVLLLWAYFADHSRLAAFLLLPLFCLTGLWHGAPVFEPPRESRHIARLIAEGQQDVVLAGFLAAAPERSGDRTRLLMATAELRQSTGTTPTHGLVQITLAGRPRQELRPGDPFLARVRLGPLHGYRVPGAMDFTTFLHRQGIWLRGWAETPLHVVPLPANPPLSWPARLRFLPERLRDGANRLILRLAPPESAPLFLGLLTGTRSEIPALVTEQFQATGATHLLAISGMNLGLITLLCTGLATWLLSRSTWALLHLPTRKIALLLALPPLLGYAAITGLQPPALRALIMVLVFMAAILSDRQWCSVNNLAIAALLILLPDPASLLGASFQLSFAATAAIILAYRFRFPLLLTPGESMASRTTAWLANGLVISVIATLATAPLCLFYFNRISLLSPLTTLILTPLLCLWAIPLGLAGLACATTLPTLASHLFTAGGWGIDASLAVVARLAALPWASFFLPTPTVLEVAAALAALLALLAWQSGKGPRIAALALAALAVASPFARHWVRVHDPTSRITFLDVGQGNAVALELPYGRSVLVDGGGMASDRFDVGERLIAPFLWDRGITRLDAVVVSHPHGDHWNGLPFILDHFRPTVLWINGHGQEEEGYAALLARAKVLGITIRVPRPGEILSQSGQARLANLEALHLAPTSLLVTRSGRLGKPDANNQSLVLQVRHGDTACLLPGDIDMKHEQGLLGMAGLESTILLAPHHGSRHSASPRFLAAVKPHTIVVSAQSGPRARFPHPEKVQEWKALGIPVLITGRVGTVRATLGGDRARVAPLTAPSAIRR